MKARTSKCKWCEKEYVKKDSTASAGYKYCSAECEAEHYKAVDEVDKWWHEISNAWEEYERNYEPEEDEASPSWRYGLYDYVYGSREEYQRLRKYYRKWKGNHCWKQSFWDGESSDVPVSDGGLGGTIAGIVILVVVGWLGWTGIKCGWNWLFGGGREVNVEAEMMKTWQQQLEQRYEAFDDGMSEKEIEAKGLRNYTWDEWQEKCRKEQEEVKVKEEKAKGTTGSEGSFVAERAKELSEQARSTAKELGEKAKGLWRKVSE